MLVNNSKEILPFFKKKNVDLAIWMGFENYDECIRRK